MGVPTTRVVEVEIDGIGEVGEEVAAGVSTGPDDGGGGGGGRGLKVPF